MRIVFTHNLQLSIAEEEAEFDRPETVSMITQGLREAGHDVEPLEVSGPASRLVARLEALNPDLVFNTAEGSRGRFREGFYPALFDQLGFAYTGSDAYVCTATLDKQFTKLVLSTNGIPTPGWRFVDDVRQLDGHELRFPLMVKPNFEGSSMGITVDSVVEDERSLRARVISLLGRYPSGVLVEEFIVGRDLVVPFVETVSPKTGGVLEPAVYDYRPDFAEQRKYQIYDYEMKSVGFDGVTVKVPADISKKTRAKAIELSRKAIRVLGVRDVGRIDYRVTEDGSLYFLEVNALPSLEQGASLYRCGALIGLDRVSKVLQAVVRSASDRHGLSLAALKRRKRPARPLVGLIHSGTLEERDAGVTPTADAVRRAIESYGHRVIELEATPELPSLLPASGVELAFNMARGVAGRHRHAQVPALLELLDIEFTGSDSAAMAFAFDKPLSKRLVREAGGRVPTAIFWRSPKDRLPRELEFPAILKPVTTQPEEEHEPVVVADESELRERGAEIIAKHSQPIVVETYVHGREFVLGLIGERRPRVLPPMEVVFGDASELPVLAGGLDRDGVSYRIPTDITPGVEKELKRVARVAFTALGCRDVARVVLRVDDKNHVHFLSCTPLPSLTPGKADLFRIAEAAGLDFRSLIGEIMAPALRRLRERRRAHLLASRT